MCVVHLVGLLRVIVAFETAEIAYVLLVGDHDERSPTLDVYRQPESSVRVSRCPVAWQQRRQGANLRPSRPASPRSFGPSAE